MPNARPFSGMDKVDIGGGDRDPFLQPRNVVRDLSQLEHRNIISCDPALYVLRIDGIEYSGTRKKGDKFKAKITVMAGNGPNAIGSRAVYMVMASSDYFQRDVMRMVTAACNAPPKPFTNSQGKQFPGFKESDFDIIISKQQPLVGMYVADEVNNNKNDGSKDASKKGNDFTTHRFSPVVPLLSDGKIIDWQPAVPNNVKEWIEANAGNKEI